MAKRRVSTTKNVIKKGKLTEKNKLRSNINPLKAQNILRSNVLTTKKYWAKGLEAAQVKRAETAQLKKVRREVYLKHAREEKARRRAQAKKTKVPLNAGLQRAHELREERRRARVRSNEGLIKARLIRNLTRSYKSALVWRMGYDRNTETCLVDYNDGARIIYYGVPEDVYIQVLHGRGFAATTDGSNPYGRWWKTKSPSVGAVINRTLMTHYTYKVESYGSPRKIQKKLTKKKP